MKIAVFENEYKQVEAAFETVNLLYYNNMLEVDNYTSSQSLQPFTNLNNYDIVIIDIDLSRKSELDGYALLAKIETLAKKPKILILTGSSKVEQTLKDKNLPNYDILLKPVDFNRVHKSLDKLINPAQS